MKVSQLKQMVKLAVQTKQPAMIWGKPGVGKSQLVAQVAEELGFDMLDWRLCLMSEVELRGIPNVADGMTYWNPPAELPRKTAKGKRPVLIFIDELPQASIPVSNAARQLILDRRLGAYVLPDDAVMIAAGNRDEDRAATSRMPSHIANSFLHYTLDVDAVEWLEWAKANGIDPRVRAFIKYRPALLHTFEPTSKERAFGSPRSWYFASQQLKQLDAQGIKLEHEQLSEMFAGIVGQVASEEFCGFLKIMAQLVDIDAIMLSPTKAGVPSDVSVCYALTYALFDRADVKNFPTIVSYLERMPQEFAFLFMKEVREKKTSLCKTKTWIDWSVKHQDFI